MPPKRGYKGTKKTAKAKSKGKKVAKAKSAKELNGPRKFTKRG